MIETCQVCGYPIVRDRTIKGGWKHKTGFVCCIFPCYRDENGKLTHATPREDIGKGDQ